MNAYQRGRACANACNTDYDFCTGPCRCCPRVCTPYTSCQCCAGYCSLMGNVSLVAATFTVCGSTTSNTCACMCGTMPFWQASFIGAGIAYGCALVGVGAYCTVRACDHTCPLNTKWPNFAAGYRGDDIVDDSTPIVVRMDVCDDAIN